MLHLTSTKKYYHVQNILRLLSCYCLLKLFIQWKKGETLCANSQKSNKEYGKIYRNDAAAKIHWSNKRGLNNNIPRVLHLRESRTFYALQHAIVWSILLDAIKHKVGVQQRIKACYCERSVNSLSSAETILLSL